MKIIKLGLLSAVSMLLFVSCGNSNSAPVGDTSQNSLDWDGVYSNVVPCGDCEGIQTTIVLNKDLTYERMLKYIGKDVAAFTENGSFSWDKDGRIITLEGMEHSPYKYLVGENKLVQYDMEGEEMDEATQKQYTLEKVSDIIGINWKLIELNGKEVASAKPKEPYFILSVENSRINGTGNCNSFSGTYTLRNGNRIKISPLASTMMACLDMKIESELYRALEIVDSYAIREDTLSLNRARMAPLAKFVAVESTEE